MKLMNRIKAFFRKNNEPVELDLHAAEIKEGKAFLHTKGDEPVTYLVRASDIEIRLNKDTSLSELDVLTIKKKTPVEKQKTLAQKDAERKDKKSQNTIGIGNFRVPVFQDILVHFFDVFKRSVIVIHTRLRLTSAKQVQITDIVVHLSPHT